MRAHPVTMLRVNGTRELVTVYLDFFRCIDSVSSLPSHLLLTTSNKTDSGSHQLEAL